MRDVKIAARALGVQLQLLAARDANEFDGAFASMAKEHVTALLVVADSLFILHRARLADLAAKNQLPSMHGVRENVDGVERHRQPKAVGSRRGSEPANAEWRRRRPVNLLLSASTTTSNGERRQSLRRFPLRIRTGVYRHRRGEQRPQTTVRWPRTRRGDVMGAVCLERPRVLCLPAFATSSVQLLPPASPEARGRFLRHGAGTTRKLEARSLREPAAASSGTSGRRIHVSRLRWTPRHGRR